jgi:DNA-binding GntR family transcriptional regulator
MGAQGTKPLRTDDAYEQIRQAIIHGALRPNEHLVEVELAERFSISRTPIREVLQRLSVEGLIVRGRRGWNVREHSRDEIRQLYEVRGSLEGAAARYAAERGSDEEFERIAAVHGRLSPGGATTLREVLVEVNDDFHMAIVDAAGNERLAQLVRQSQEYFFNFRVARLYSDEETIEAVEDHGAILAALLERDADRADRLAREHVVRALELSLEKIGPIG